MKIKTNAVLPLLVINLIFFGLQEFITGFTQNFVLVSNQVAMKPWILLTSMFMHGSFTHLLFNMYALWIFGPLIEQRIGTKRFLLAYFGAGIIAALAFVVFNPTSSALGASGAIMGILGLVIMLLPKMRVLFFFVIPMSMRTAGILFAIIDLVGFVSAANTGIAHIAHLAGLAVGVAYGYYLIDKRKQYAEKQTHKLDLSMSQEEIDEYFKNGRI